MFVSFIQTFQAVILWSIICKIDARYRTYPRYRPPPVMTMTNYEIRFFPRQSYCLNLLKVIEDTDVGIPEGNNYIGGYNGLRVFCQRHLCKYYEERQKYCATNGKFSKTFRNQCFLCAKGCEELNRGRRMFRSEYEGECRERDPSHATTDAISTLETSIRVTSAPKDPVTRPSTSQYSTQLTTSLKEGTYFGTTSISEDAGDSSFTIVVHGSTVVVATSQPFTSPFTSVTTSDSPYLSTDQFTTLESFSTISSTQFTPTYVAPSTSVRAINTSLSTFPSTPTTDFKTKEIERSFQPHETTSQLETDDMVTSQAEVPASSKVPTLDQATTMLSAMTSILFTGKADVMGTTLPAMGIQEENSTQLETDAFITLQTEVLATSALQSVDQKTIPSSHSLIPTVKTVGGRETIEPQGLQNRCKKQRNKLNNFKTRYQINPYLEEQLCVKNDKHFLINCETMKYTSGYERLSTSIPEIPDIFFKDG